MDGPIDATGKMATHSMHKLVCYNVGHPINKLRLVRTDNNSTQQARVCTVYATFTALPHDRSLKLRAPRHRFTALPHKLPASQYAAVAAARLIPAVAPPPQSTYHYRQDPWQPLPPSTDTHSLPPAAVAGGFGWALRDGGAHAALAAWAMDAVHRGLRNFDADRPRCLAADPTAQGEAAGRSGGVGYGAAPADGGSARADEWVWEGPGPGPADDASDPFRAGW